MTADLVVELHGKRVGMLAGPWRAFGFLPDSVAVAVFGIDSPVLSVAIPLTAVPVRSRKARRQNFFRELLPLLGDGLAVLALLVLEPDRPPPSAVLAGGYTVIPWSSSMTSPSPRVAARVSTPVTRAVAARTAFGCLRQRACGRTFCSCQGAPRRGCGDSAGILKIAVATCVIRFSHFRLFAGQNGLKLTKIWSR